MKQKISFALLLSAICFITYSCKDKTTGSYMANTPIYMEFDEFRQAEFGIESARPMKNPGKIWIKDQYLFVNEVLKGFHIFDNSNPSNPLNIGFIEIYASTDLAVRGNILYADNYNDLLSFDITNPSSPELICRTNDVFNFEAANNLTGYDPSYPSAGVIWDKGVILGWNQEEVTEEIGGQVAFNDAFTLNDVAIFGANESSNSAGISNVSIGGSMARFSITGNHLQVLEKRVLSTYALNENCPTPTSTVNIWREGETLFSANGHLFIGTTTGMLIYNLDSPENPTFVSDYPHVNSCDPVVVSGNKAYVTLRTGNRCQGDINELVIVDISDLTNPTEIATYQMTNPHGLGIDGNTLFLCDGSDGLKVFDRTDDYDLGNNMISHFQEINTYDVIPYNDNLIMSSGEGIYQYDYSDISNITEISLIPVQ